MGSTISFVLLIQLTLLLEVSLFSFHGMYMPKPKKVLHKIIELAFHLMSPPLLQASM
jgi:hypothetical protein